MNENEPLPIRIGGLFRCCIATWSEIAPPAAVTSEGDTLACSYCDASMIVRDGEWHWNHDEPPSDSECRRCSEQRPPRYRRQVREVERRSKRSFRRWLRRKSDAR